MIGLVHFAAEWWYTLERNNQSLLIALKLPAYRLLLKDIGISKPV